VVLVFYGRRAIGYSFTARYLLRIMSIPAEEIERQLAAATDDVERLALLNALAFDLSRTDPRRGLELAAEADRLALALDDPAARAESLRVAAWCHETLSDYPTAMSHADQARRLFAELGDRAHEGSCLNAVGVIAFGMARFTEALDALHRARAIFTETGNQQSLASACNNTGMVYQELGRFPEALAAYLEALRINEELGDEAQAAVNIGNVGNVYYYLGDGARSFEYDLRALEVARRRGDAYSIAHRLENISSNYKARGEHDAALEALNEALGIFRRLQEKRYEASTLVKLGMLYELRDEPERALEQFEQAAGIAESIGRHDLLVNAQLRIGMIHSRRGSHQAAITVLRQGLANAKETAMLKLESELLLILAGALDAVGEHAEAFRHMRQHALHLETLYGEERQRAVAETQARFDVERAEREREVFRLRSEHLEEMMELRSSQLTSMAMRLVRKNAFLQKLRKDTLQLAARNPASKDLLDTLLRAIIENTHGDDEWERFEQEFQRIHHDFLKMLSQRCPLLTPAELKVCAMLKINLSNKEMANLLSVSLRSIESHRYSIRKKLGLPSDINLTAYLIAL
jgi:tetratricopeptide (TPR) repeat protein/DNA-binding CsgD family transcriptional regulator